MTVRAKFRVQRVDSVMWQQNGEDVKGQENVLLHPVYSEEPDSENRRFWEATPGGQISLQITNKGAFGVFEEGKEYLIDFTPAPVN